MLAGKIKFLILSGPLQLGFGLADESLELGMLVGVGLLECARYVGGVRGPDDVLEPSSEKDRLGPLAPEAVGEHERLGPLGADELDEVGADLLVHPGSRLAPNLESGEQLLSFGWLELEQALDPASQKLADWLAFLVLDLLACARGVLDISLEHLFLEVDVSDSDMLRARHQENRLLLDRLGRLVRVEPVLDPRDVD